MEFGALIDSTNDKGFTPLFFATSTGSSTNLIELLDNGANIDHKTEDEKTALTKSKSYETMMILTKYGIDTKNQHKDKNGNLESDLDILLKRHFECSPGSILNQCISEVNEELLVLDFGHFKNTSEEKNEMDVHIKVHEQGMDELLLHPILQMFLDFKWDRFQYTFFIHLLLELLLVVLLTKVGQNFMHLIYCEHEGDVISRDEWYMNIFDSNFKHQ